MPTPYETAPTLAPTFHTARWYADAQEAQRFCGYYASKDDHPTPRTWEPTTHPQGGFVVSVLDTEARPLFVQETDGDRLNQQLGAAVREASDGDRYCPRFRAAVEAAEWALSRWADRRRHEPAFADAFLRRARLAVLDAAELAAPPLTPVEAQEVWDIARDIAGDESTRDRAEQLVEEWGVLGARDVLQDQRDAEAEEEGEA